MRLLISLATLFFCLTLTSSYAQKETEKETVITADGSTSTITSNSSGMYAGTQNADAQNFFDLAVEASRAGKIDDAVKYYKKSIKKDPKFVEAYDNLAVLYRRMEQMDEAIKYYKKSIELYPEGPMAHQNLALVYSITNQPELAIKEYETLIKINVQNPEGYFGLANCYMTQRKFDKALENAEKALELYQSTNSHHLGDGYLLIGYIYYYKEDQENAKTNFAAAKENGARLDPRIETEFFPNSEPKDSDDDDPLKLETEEDYIAAEKQVINGFAWFVNNPPNKNKDTKDAIVAFLIKWVTGSPTVSIELSEKVAPYLEACPDCLIAYMGGVSIYQIKTRDLENRIKAALSGTEVVIMFYEAHKSTLGKNKDIEKLMRLQKQGKLEAYIKDNLK